MLAACAAPPGPPRAAPPAAPALAVAEIATDGTGACWGRDVEPAVIQTVTVTEAAGSPGAWRSLVRQRIAEERRPIAFETLCPPAYTEGFVASLQRALQARGYFAGPADGAWSEALGRAVQDFQRGWGPDSPLLSLAAARRLGLVALSEAELARL